MNFLKSFRTLTVFLLPPLLQVRNAIACPDCTLINSGGTIEPQTIAAKMAFSASTLILMGIFFSVVGFLVWTMVKTCRELSRERSPSSSLEC